MAGFKVSDLRPVVRVLLGDHWAPYQYEDALVDAGIVAALKLGKLPGYSAAADVISPDLTSVTDFARLSYEAGILFVAPEGEYSYRRRAVSESFKERRNLLAHLQRELHELQSGGAAGTFSSHTNFVTWLAGAAGLDLGAWQQTVGMEGSWGTVSVEP